MEKTMNILTTAPAQSVAVEQTRVIKASRKQVFLAWTDPAILKQWFGPTQKHCAAADLDVRVGGAYRIEIHGNASADTETAPPQACAMGRYTKIMPYELLQFTWLPSWSEGEESLVTISLRDVQGGTELHLRHEKFLSDQSREGHQAGWAGSLDKLAALLEGQA
jgi:uncharacterized protein YndB with AHSA1/START domain